MLNAAFLYKTRAWSSALWPYVWQTLTLRRPIQNRRLRRVTVCPGLDEYFALDVNGHPQWLRIRGHSASNPVILYLHGGPGGAQIPSYRHYQLGWESRYTMVHWEQRGAGRSWAAGLDTKALTLPQLVADARLVIEYLRNRFRRADIVLLGHSWGTLLAIHVLRDCADGISAYVGVGQIANLVESEERMFEFALAEALADGNRRALSQLGALDGYPRHNSAPDQVAVVRYWARTYGFRGSNARDDGRNHTRLMKTPEYSLLDVYRYLQGSLISARRLGRVMFTNPAVQPEALDRRFSVPMFLISGRRDHFTPSDLSDRYLNSISAPAKRHVVFEHSGHYPNEDEPERFINTVEQLVRPYLAPNRKEGQR